MKRERKKPKVKIIRIDEIIPDFKNRRRQILELKTEIERTRKQLWEFEKQLDDLKFEDAIKIWESLQVNGGIK